MGKDEEKIYKLLTSESTRRKAFEMIVKSYGESLYWKIRYIVLTHDDANDVLQNTFLKAWSNIGSFRGKSKLSTWLYSIAINEALDYLRKSRNTLNADAADGMSVAGKLMADEYISGHPGISTSTLRLKREDMLAFVSSTGHEPIYIDLPDPRNEE